MCYSNALMCMYSIADNIQTFDSTPRRYPYPDNTSFETQTEHVCCNTIFFTDFLTNPGIKPVDNKINTTTDGGSVK